MVRTMSASEMGRPKKAMGTYPDRPRITRNLKEPSDFPAPGALERRGYTRMESAGSS
jgi:hypothetical protein